MGVTQGSWKVVAHVYMRASKEGGGDTVRVANNNLPVQKDLFDGEVARQEEHLRRLGAGGQQVGAPNKSYPLPDGHEQR